MNVNIVFNNRLYEFICRNFLATVSPDARFNKKNVKFQCGNNFFTLSGTSVVYSGFTEVHNFE